MYRTAGNLVIGKPPPRQKPWISDLTWALIEMRNNLNKDIEATPFVAVLHCTRRDKSSHVEKLAKSAEESAFVGDL